MTSTTSDIVARLRPNAVVDHVPGMAVSNLRRCGCDDLADQLNEWIARNNGLKSEAAALISSLVAERDDLAAMIQRLVAAGNEDVALMREMGETITSAQDRANTAERLLAEARAVLTLIAADLQSSIDTHEFNSRHMIAEDSLQDAWKMLDMAREQFQVDANSLKIPLAKARAALGEQP